MSTPPRTPSKATAASAIPSRKFGTGGDTRPPAAISTVERDEAADLAAARAGDNDAFARIYDRIAPVVLSLCRQRSLAEAEDATQETFIRAHRLLHKVDDPRRLRPWIYAIARRVCSERTRAARRRKRPAWTWAEFSTASTQHATCPIPMGMVSGMNATDVQATRTRLNPASAVVAVMTTPIRTAMACRIAKINAPASTTLSLPLIALPPSLPFPHGA